MNNTIQELELIKRTAWMNANRDPRQATQEEADKITPNVISAIVYCAALVDLYPYIRRLMECKLPYQDKGEVIERIIDSASQEVINLTRFKKILTE